MTQNFLRLESLSTIESDLINFRQHLHQHPELSNEEFKTTQTIKEKLATFNLTPLDLNLKTGLVVSIKGAQPGPIIVLRGDIDALPIQEEAEISNPSLNPGIMHACGHDFHASAVLGAAAILEQNKHLFNGEIRVLFQSAEETGLGAPEFIKVGVLEGAKAIFGLHNDPTLPLGTIGSKAGELTAGVDRFELTIYAKGAHAAKPHEGNDPIIILGQIITSLQSIISRRVASNENAVVSITQVTSGSTWNVIPDTAYIQGTVRTFGAQTRSLINQQFHKIIKGIGETFGASIEIKWHQGPPSVTNDKTLVEYALSLAKANQFEAEYVNASPIGEDFAFFQEVIPGAFVMVGMGEEYPLHHPKFKVNDSILYKTAHYLAELAANATR